MPGCLKTILSSRKKRLGDVSAYIRTLLVSIDRIVRLSENCKRYMSGTIISPLPMDRRSMPGQGY
ncbi:MAG: hypothetical protein ACLQDF_01545 [Desulfomonilia bacterium]